MCCCLLYSVRVQHCKPTRDRTCANLPVLQHLPTAQERSTGRSGLLYGKIPFITFEQECFLTSQKYSMSWDPSYSSTSSQDRGGDRYSIAYSFTYSNATSPGSPRIPCPVVTASSIIAASTLDPYCSTLLGYTTPVVTSTNIVTLTVPSTTIRTTTTRTTTLTSTITATSRITTDPNAANGVATEFKRRAVPTDAPSALQTFDCE